MRASLLLLCLALGLAVGQQEEAGFDLFLLVRSYSPGFCLEEKCDIVPVSAFTLHGLWPEYTNGGWPQFCKTANATGPPPANSDAMRCEWASFMGNNAQFWDHEWEKHGTCSEPVLGNRPQYFQKVLELNQKYDLDTALAARGIVPSNTRGYPLASVRRAVAASYGQPPVLHCHGAAVVELWMCLSLDLEPIPCPKHVLDGNSCPATVHLPEGEPVPTACKRFFPPLAQELTWDRRFLAALGLAAAGVVVVMALACFTRRDSTSAKAGYASMA